MDFMRPFIVRDLLNGFQQYLTSCCEKIRREDGVSSNRKRGIEGKYN